VPGKAKPAASTERYDSPAFDELAAALLAEGGIEDGSQSGRRGFGSNGLKVAGKLFAMPVKGRLVLKLPRDRVAALVASGSGGFFDPGHGRLMREWIALDLPPREWKSLAREARDYVKGTPG